MTFLTTVTIRNGLPGYADSDYEYFYTAEHPTECELEQFEREACRGYFNVRSIKVHTEMVKVVVPETQKPHGDA